MKVNYVLVIVGCGPRGLALALQATLEGIPFLLIDSFPLRTWSEENLLVNFNMRSPIQFDLVSYLSEYQKFSLSKYLKREDINFSKSQKEIENYIDRNLTRNEFINYLNYIRDFIKEKNPLSFLKARLINIDKENEKTYILTLLKDNQNRTEQISCNSVAICTGGSSYPILPENLKSCNNCITITSLIKQIKDNSIPRSPNLGVVGSGQNAFETAHFLAEMGKRVYLFIKESPKKKRYPVPSYEDIKEKSALGYYYSSLISIEEKKEYLSMVKNWQPSITPELLEDVYNHKMIEVLNDNPYDYKDLINKFVILVGHTFNIKTIDLFKNSNFKNSILEDDIKSSLPKLTKSFNLKVLTKDRNLEEELIFFSGISSISLDGPRQGSIISSGITAQAIINKLKQSL